MISSIMTPIALDDDDYYYVLHWLCGIICTLTEIQYCVFYFGEKRHWNFGGDSIKFIDHFSGIFLFVASILLIQKHDRSAHFSCLLQFFSTVVCIFSVTILLKSNLLHIKITMLCSLQSTARAIWAHAVRMRTAVSGVASPPFLTSERWLPVSPS